MNWGIMRAMTVTLSGFGLFQIAYELGVKHLDKFEACTDFRSTSVVLASSWLAIKIALARTEATNANVAHDVRATIKLMSDLILSWLVHFRGIRLGRLDMQVRTSGGMKICGLSGDRTGILNRG